MENYKELLTALYKEHAPEKLDQLDFYLSKYKGKEKQFYITQKAKYANKKSVKDSKKILEEAMARINKGKQGETDEKADKSVLDETEKPIKTTKKEVLKENKEEALIAPVISKGKDINPTTKVKEPQVDQVKQPEVKEKAGAEENKNPTTIKEEPKKVVTPTVKTEKKSIDPIVSSTSARSDEEVLREGIRKDPYKRQNQNKEKKRTPYLWLIYLLIFFVAVAFIIYLFTYPIAFFENKSSKSENIEQTVIEPRETSEETEFINDELQNNEGTASIQSKEAEANTRALMADRLYATDIQGRVIFVACFAEKKESLAQQKVAQLKEFGLMGHYYWIPDINPRGNAYFKIVVGPFKTHKEAYPSLTKVQERINFDAYILVVEP